MRVLVLGGAGYIGSVLVEYLESQRDSVTVMDTCFYEKSPEKLKSAKLVLGDIRNINDLLPLISASDAVVNLAAISNDPASDLKPEITWDINYKANEMIANLCLATRKRVIFASSCSVYGFSENELFTEESDLRPVSLYAMTKMLSEEFYKHPQLDSYILRFATVYGYSPKPRFDLVVNTMSGTAYFGKKIIVNGGKQCRPVVHVKDVARAIHMALHKKDPKQRILNVGSNEQNYTISSLAQEIVKELPSVEIIEHEDSIDGRSYSTDFTKIKNELGFSTHYTVQDAIREIHNAFKIGEYKSMDEDVYFRVKYLTKHVYKEPLIKRISNIAKSVDFRINL